MGFVNGAVKKEFGLKTLTHQTALHVDLAGQYRIDTALLNSLCQLFNAHHAAIHIVWTSGSFRLLLIVVACQLKVSYPLQGSSARALGSAPLPTLTRQ